MNHPDADDKLLRAVVPAAVRPPDIYLGMIKPRCREYIYDLFYTLRHMVSLWNGLYILSTKYHYFL